MIGQPWFTEEEARMIRDYSPTLGDRPPGIDLVTILEGKLTEIVNEFAASAASLALIKSGSGEVLSGNSSVTISDTALTGLGGKPVFATLGEADGTVALLNVEWSGDDIVITLDAVTTGDRTVHWLVDGR